MYHPSICESYCYFWLLFQIDTLSKVNHKNFVNLIGFCEEDKPFTRMMVFEYAPNGTLFEHLHSEYLPFLNIYSHAAYFSRKYVLYLVYHDLLHKPTYVNMPEKKHFLFSPHLWKMR